MEVSVQDMLLLLNHCRTSAQMKKAVQDLARDLANIPEEPMTESSGETPQRCVVDPEVLLGLPFCQIMARKDCVLVLSLICRFLILLGDRTSLSLALNLTYKIYEIERERQKSSYIPQLYKGIAQIGSGNIDIGIRKVMAVLSRQGEDPISTSDEALSFWALCSAAIADRNIHLASMYADKWLCASENANLEAEMLRSRMAVHLIALLAGSEDNCLTETDGFSPDTIDEWNRMLIYLEEWNEAARQRVCPSPPTVLSEPHPLFLGLHLFTEEPGSGVTSESDFSRLCRLRRRFCDPALANETVPIHDIQDYATLLAQWELLKPLQGIEKILKERSPERYYQFCMGRILGKQALELISVESFKAGRFKVMTDVIIWMMDVRNFSAFCGEHPPDFTFDVLGPLFKIMNDELTQVGGAISEFTGDAIMVVFRPDPGENLDISSILSRTVQCLQRIRILNSLSLPAGLPELAVGVGIDKGPVASGYLGSLARCHPTVMGNTVNTAARIESLTKEQPGAVLVSQTCFDNQEPDVWSKPLEVHFSLRDIGCHHLKNIAMPPRLLSVNPLLQYWVDFVPMGFMAEPEEGVIYIDTGNSDEAGIIDHHFAGHKAKSACELLVDNQQLLKGHVHGIPPSKIEFRLHTKPDLDCAATLYAAQELMDKYPRESLLKQLAAYVSLIDQGIIPHPETMSESLYGVFIAHEKILEQKYTYRLTDDILLEGGLRVIDAAFHLMEKAKYGGDFSRIFQLQPGWFEEERRLIKEDLARYQEDVKLRGHGYKARVKGRSDPVAGLWLDHPQSILFKFWARMDPKAPGGNGYGFLGVDWSNPEKKQNRFVISVDPQSGTNLCGLGLLLEKEETDRRTELNMVRPTYPIRCGNSDPWYFGWGHEYTIVDSPRAGTVLTALRVQELHESWQPDDV